MDNVNLHRMRLKANIPENGSIRMLVVTEKQYESIELLLGQLTVEEESPPTETITLFDGLLYHTKNRQGTTTAACVCR